MRKIIMGLAMLSLMATQGAYADQVAANTCAEKLPPQARLVFDAVSAHPQPDFTLRALLESRVRELVFFDRLMRSAARPAAEGASECLRIARNCTADAC